MITNRQMARTKEQIFASNNAYNTPFYGREESIKEMRNKFSKIKEDEPYQFIISYPLGTGKSFFMEQISSDINGSQEPPMPLFLKNIYNDPSCLKDYPEEIIFVDECDIKTPWSVLKGGLMKLAEYTETEKRKAVIVGDYTLRNPEISSLFKHQDHLNNFEPLDKNFLKGVINQRGGSFLDLPKDCGEVELLDKSLLEILTPTDMVKAVTFRSVLSTLESISNLLPFNDQKCLITTDLAKSWLEKEFDPPISTQKQEDYLNILLEFITTFYPRGKGLRNGLTAGQLYEIAHPVGYTDFKDFNESIITPFVRAEIIISGGIPYHDEVDGFIRHPEPFYISTATLLLAEQ